MDTNAVTLRLHIPLFEVAGLPGVSAYRAISFLSGCQTSSSPRCCFDDPKAIGIGSCAKARAHHSSTGIP
jgi:hypothetical protein